MNEKIMDRFDNGSMKWEPSYIEKRFGVKVCKEDDMYPLFIADMDYEMSDELKSRLMDICKEPDFGYFHIQESFYDSIISWYHGLIQREWIFASLGTVTSINIFCELYARGENILMMTPIYGSFKNLGAIGNIVTCPLVLKEMRYEIDFSLLEEKMKDCKVFVLCNPHNPSGRVWTREEISKMVLLCKKYDVILLSDEIHSDFHTSDCQFTSIYEFFDLYDKMVVSSSANKLFNISSLTTSYILCPNAMMRNDFDGFLNRMHLSYNRMGIEMTTIAYTYGRNWANQLNQMIKENIKLVEEILQGSGMELMKPDSGYLVWIYLPNVTDVDAFVRKLACETHVFLETGSRFIENYKGFIRLNVATSRSLLCQALALFKDFYVKNY